MGLISLVVIYIMFSDEIIIKLTGDDFNSTTFSRYDRVASIISGLNMFFDNPLFGVGIQGYAFALPYYADPFIQDNFDWSFRRIANNIYIEILSEQGMIGITAMAVLMTQICKKPFSSFRKNAIICSGFLSIAGSWFAFPTYTVSFHWIGFAIFYRLASYGAQESRGFDTNDSRCARTALSK
jgi:O-antigen ligase